MILNYECKRMSHFGSNVFLHLTHALACIRICFISMQVARMFYANNMYHEFYAGAYEYSAAIFLFKKSKKLFTFPFVGAWPCGFAIGGPGWLSTR